MNEVSMTAREFIDRLVDDGSFVELDKYIRKSNAVYGYADVSAAGEGVITGWGRIEGRPVCVFAQDKAVLGGSLGEAQANKIVKIIAMAKKCGYPLVARWCSDGARVQEGAAAANAYVEIAKALNDVSGVIPTVSVAASEMLGISAAFAAMTDFTVAVENLSACGLHAPMVLASKEGADVNLQEIEGAKVMAEDSGLAQFLCADELAALNEVKKLMAYLPSNNLDSMDMEFSEDDVNREIVADTEDTRALAADIADNGSFYEVGVAYCADMITGFIRLDGISCGVVANAAGCTMNSKSYKKAARFISILNAYDIPIITIINNEGTQISMSGVRHCQTAAYAQLLFEYALAGCAKVALITGKAIGEGWAAMGAGACHDISYAYPDAKIGCMDSEAGSIMLYGTSGREREYEEKFLSAMTACEQGVIDDVINTKDTRKALIEAVDFILNKREERPLRKQPIMPL